MADDLRPQIVPSIYILRQGGRSLYLNPDAPDWLSVKERYAFILDACDGKTSIRQIREMVACRMPAEADVLRSQIDHSMATSKIFCHNWSQEKPSISARSELSLALKYVYLTLTDACNLKCSYCYAKDRKPVAGCTFDDWRAFVTQALQVSAPITFTLTGGEPLLAPFAADLGGFVRDNGSKSVLLTNGSLIASPDLAQQVTNAFDMVRVSIDSLDESKNSRFRGPGVLSKALRAYDLLRAAGANVQVLATVTKDTLDDVSDLAEHFGNAVTFQPLYRKGRARGNTQLHISGIEYFRALSAANVRSQIPGLWQNIHAFRGSPYRRCALAAEEISVGPDGTVYPCHMLHYPDFAVGNLKERHLKEIYCTSDILLDLRKLNVDCISKCRKCPVKYFCGGACRARVDISVSDLEKPDPFCSYERNAILDALLRSFG